MVSQLALTSVQLHNRLTNIPYCRSICYWDSQMNLKIQKNFSKRLPFYLGNFVTIFFIIVPSLFMILSAIINQSSKLPVIIMVCHGLYLGFLNFYLYFNWILMSNSNDYIKYISLIFKTTPSLRKSSSNNVLSQIIHFFRMWDSEQKKILQPGKSVDYVGIMVASNVFYSILLMFLLPVAVVYLNIDPLFHFIKMFIYSPNEAERWSPLNVFIIIFRFWVFAFANFDINRTNGLFANVIFVQFPVCKVLLLRVKGMALGFEKISKFNQIRLIYSVGSYYTSSIIALTLGVGFMIIVFSNCFVLVGFEKLSANVYLLGFPACVIAHAIIGTMLSTAAKIYEICEEMIYHEWRYELVDLVNKTGIVSLKVYKRLFKTMRPVTFKSGNFATIERTTKLNYYSDIMSDTLNLFLLVNQAKR